MDETNAPNWDLRLHDVLLSTHPEIKFTKLKKSIILTSGSSSCRVKIDEEGGLHWNEFHESGYDSSEKAFDEAYDYFSPIIAETEQLYYSDNFEPFTDTTTYNKKCKHNHTVHAIRYIIALLLSIAGYILYFYLKILS